jgi:hypothetical protein
MSFPPVYNPVVANPNDGELITQCKTLDAVSTGLGSSGRIVPASTAATAGSYKAIQFVSSGTLTAYSGNISGTVTGVTFPAGFVLYGLCTSFSTGSGTTVVAYSA